MFVFVFVLVFVFLLVVNFDVFVCCSSYVFKLLVLCVVGGLAIVRCSCYCSCS